VSTGASIASNIGNAINTFTPKEKPQRYSYLQGNYVPVTSDLDTANDIDSRIQNVYQRFVNPSTIIT
jgi:hypothetical protein